jgi:hypothetical protein
MTGMDQQPPKSALPLLALLVLASALGVAVAIALAGAALLLAAPAYADERGLFLERPDGLAGAKLVSVDSESHDDGLTSVVETYVNPFHEPLAGLYVFRPPPNALVERFAVSFGSAEAHPAMFTLREGRALVQRVDNIAPGATVRVQLEYRSRSARRVLARCSLPS